MATRDEKRTELRKATEKAFRGNSIEAFNKALAEEVREFLLKDLKGRSLSAYVTNRVGFLGGSGLSQYAQEFLLESDYARVREVMSLASQPARWLAVWLV